MAFEWKRYRGANGAKEVDAENCRGEVPTAPLPPQSSTANIAVIAVINARQYNTDLHMMQTIENIKKPLPAKAKWTVYAGTVNEGA